MADNRALTRLANEVEDVASELYVFRDRLPSKATEVTETVAALFDVSSDLRRLDNAQADPRSSPSFYRIERDLDQVLPTLRRTLREVSNMLDRCKDKPYQLVWDDLCHQMEREEGFQFLERLRWYHEFLHALLDHVLAGYEPRDLRDLRRRLMSLRDAQQVSQRRAQRHTIDASAPSTPRPRRPPLSRLATPMSPPTDSDGRDDSFRRSVPRQTAPEPPPRPMLNSPAFTSGSSRTLSSSETSYSGDNGYVPAPPSLAHWVQDVFDGQNPGTPFRDSYQLSERSVCHGNADSSSLHHLAQDGFQRALELPFDREQLWLRLYFRPSDSRARVLITTKDSSGRDQHYCVPLTNLKVIRNKSTLQLCRFRTEGGYRLWARLNFYLYERMVLFYCAFVAMKRQDRRDLPVEDLLDKFELEGPSRQHRDEELLFSGQIKDGDLRLALRLYKDQGSGVVRIEAAALRGPMNDVPIWTAFITRYAGDPDWAFFEGEGVVSLVALRPPPYVFLAGYEPPQNRKREYILQFTTNDDAKIFIEIWTGLCRAS